MPNPSRLHLRKATPANICNADPSDIHKGVSHYNLTIPAHQNLVATLKRHGNNLNQNHKDVLLALLSSMTEMAQGRVQGRYAFGLPTGFGKTSAVTSWVSTLFGEGAPYHQLSVSIAASKVEALCNLHRELVSAGVPEELIGLVHSYKPLEDWTQGMDIPVGFASIASTPPDEDRPIVLVTHNKIRSGVGNKRFIDYRGKLRDLMLYDESLIVSDSTGIDVRLLRGALAWLQEVNGEVERYRKLLDYLTISIAQVQHELDRQKRDGTLSAVIHLHELDQEIEQSFLRLLSQNALMEPALNLLALHRSPLRVVSTGQGGIVQYDISVPSELNNILVLDASYPIRSLIHFDSTIMNAETTLPAVKRIGVPFSHLKSFENVTIKQMCSGGGRSTLAEDLLKPEADRQMTKEVAAIIKAIPSDEAVLIFTYKKRADDKVDFKTILTNDLSKAGVDVGHTLPNGLKRINFATWGMETNLNNYVHCEHVILSGVLQRSPIDLTANFIGQSDDLMKPVPKTLVSDLGLSEVSHMVYQALSRGSCRVMEQGKAKAMTAYLIHRDPTIKGMLDRVMPNAKWSEWHPITPRKKSRGIVATTAFSIVEFLGNLPSGVNSISTAALRPCMQLEVSTENYKRAIHKVPSMCAWGKQGRSFVRLFPETT